jgi:RNA polymerase sigma-70 factor (ECF subfamily)
MKVSRNSPKPDEITRLLQAWGDGDPTAFDQVMPLVYDELHRIAARYLAGEQAAVSYQATALVNELCVRLLGWGAIHWKNRAHFFGVSAQMMRRVLVDIARKRRAERRGGPNSQQVPLDDVEVPSPGPARDLIAIDNALEALALEDPRKARLGACPSNRL